MDPSQNYFDGLAKLSQTTSIAFSVERELTSKESPQLAATARFTAQIENASVRTVLDWLCKLDPRYSWELNDHTVNFFPRYVKAEKEYPLNQRVTPFELVDATSAIRATIALSRHVNPTLTIAVHNFGRTDFSKPITLRFENTTAREALDQIAQALGPTYGWQFTGTKDFYLLYFHDRLMPSPPTKPK